MAAFLFGSSWNGAGSPDPMGKEQRMGSLAGSCTATVQRTGHLQAKQSQPGRDAPRAALIKVPQLFPLCKTSLFHLWATIKRLSRGERWFCPAPPPPYSIPDEDGSRGAGGQAAEPSHLLRLLESLS